MAGLQGDVCGVEDDGKAEQLAGLGGSERVIGESGAEAHLQAHLVDAQSVRLLVHKARERREGPDPACQSSFGDRCRYRRTRTHLRWRRYTCDRKAVVRAPDGEEFDVAGAAVRELDAAAAAGGHQVCGSLLVAQQQVDQLAAVGQDESVFATGDGARVCRSRPSDVCSLQEDTRLEEAALAHLAAADEWKPLLESAERSRLFTETCRRATSRTEGFQQLRREAERAAS